MTSLEELLRRDGVLVYKTRGRSMLPMLREDRDLVTVVPPKEPQKKGDVILFRLESGVYVLHRVIGTKEGLFITRGDNNYTADTAPVKEVLGVLTGFKRRGKEYSVRHPGYRLYAFLWTALFPMRRAAFRIRRRLRRILKRLPKK